MQIKLFTLPLLTSEGLNDELNRFLRSQKIIDVDKQLVTLGDAAFWSFCITYLPVTATPDTPQTERREKIDYKQVLDEKSFERFTRLRGIRKQIAEREAIPAYAVFTDAELAEIAKAEVPSIALLRAIPGIGERKIEKFGIEICRMPDDETGRISD